MLVLMLSMLALAQEPSPAAAVAEPSLDVVAVTGTPELDAAAAYRAALTAAEARQHDGKWTVTKVLMSRSARRLMEGWVHVPV